MLPRCSKSEHIGCEDLRPFRITKVNREEEPVTLRWSTGSSSLFAVMDYQLTNQYPWIPPHLFKQTYRSANRT